MLVLNFSFNIMVLAKLKTPLAVAALVLLLGLMVPGALAAACDLQITTKLSRAKVKRENLLSLTYHVHNTGTADVTPAFRVVLPPGVVLKKAFTKRNMGAYKNDTVPTTLEDDPYTVSWPVLPIAEGRTRKFHLKLQVANCKIMPETFLFGARAVVSTGDVVACESIAPVGQALIRESKYKAPRSTARKEKSANAMCPLDYKLVQSGYKCETANQPTSFLGDNPTVADCFSYCYYYGDTSPPTPFYFNYGETSAGQSSCTCVGAVCTPVADPDYRAYQSLEGALPPPPPLPTGPQPAVIDAAVTPGSIADGILYPAPGVWNQGYDSKLDKQQIMDITDATYVTAETGISPVPSTLTDGQFDSAYLMQTTNSESR